MFLALFAVIALKGQKFPLSRQEAIKNRCGYLINGLYLTEIFFSAVITPWQEQAVLRIISAEIVSIVRIMDLRVLGSYPPTPGASCWLRTAMGTKGLVRMEAKREYSGSGLAWRVTVQYAAGSGQSGGQRKWDMLV